MQSRFTKLISVIIVFVIITAAAFISPVSAHHRPGHTKGPSPTPTIIPTPTPTLTPTPTPTINPTPTPTLNPTPTPTNPPVAGGIPYGVFDEAGSYWTDHARFQAHIADVKAHNMRSSLWVNGRIRDNNPLLTIADGSDFDIYGGWVMGDFNDQWYSQPIAATIENARAAIGDEVDIAKVHPSLKGWNVIDDANLQTADKVKLAGQVIAERDTRPWSPTYVWDTLSRDTFAVVQSPVKLMYDYPAHDGVAACGWANEWVSRLRVANSNLSSNTPLWLILQTHQTFGTSSDSLRYPSVEELRLQNFIALGEGADGIWWFHYESIGGEWLGLKDNPTLFTEVGDLARRTRSLPKLTNASDTHTVAGGYASDMANGYLVLANISCSSANLVVNPATRLTNIETGVLYEAGASIPFRGGDGGIFRITP